MTDPVFSFASELIANLDRLAERVRNRVAPPGPRVLVLPGLPGTELGQRGPVTDDAIWFEFSNIRAGRLLDLAYGGPPLEPLGVFNMLYLQIVLRLQGAGYDAAVHPFDWRRPIRELGEELAAHVRAEEREVHLVTHGMGGLVARAAIALGAPNLGKVVMLAPPNHGSFSVVQSMRGSHWVLHLLSAIDGRRTPDQLAAQVFSTWPSIYAQIPARDRRSEIDLCDPDAWPQEGPRPNRDLLLGASRIREWIEATTGQFYVIAGHGVPTVDHIERRDGVFHYARSRCGDGWVPWSAAELDGYPCYHARAGHLSMPNHEDVIGAVEDLLARGATTRLPLGPPPAPERCSPLSDDAPPSPPFGGRRGPELGDDDIREALRHVLGLVAPLPIP